MPDSRSDRTAADLAQGRLLLQVRRHKQAQQRLERVVAARPGEYEAWCLLALCHSAFRRPRDMVTAAERAIATEPDQEWGQRLRSYALSELGRLDESLAAAREAVRLAPDSWKTQAQLALALESLGLAECLGAAKRAAELGPGEPGAHFVLGHVAMGVLFVGDLAERSFRRALELDPHHARARASLAALQRGDVAPATAPPPPSQRRSQSPARTGWGERLRGYLHAAAGRNRKG